MPRKSISEAESQEELQLSRLFELASTIASLHYNVRTIAGVSSCLRLACAQISRGTPADIFASNLHIKLCQTNEIKLAMMESALVNYFTNRGGKSAFEVVRLHNSDVAEYFQLLALYAHDVGLTYRYDPATLYGEIWYNSAKGPDFWK